MNPKELKTIIPISYQHPKLIFIFRKIHVWSNAQHLLGPKWRKRILKDVIYALFFSNWQIAILASVHMTKLTGAAQQMKVKMSIFDQSQWRIWTQVLRKPGQAQFSTVDHLDPLWWRNLLKTNWTTQFSVYLLQTNTSSINLERVVLLCKGL